MSNDTYLNSTRESDTSYSIAKVFGYMFIWLLITTALTFGLAFLFNYLLETAASDEARANIFMVAVVIAGISGLAIIIMSIVTHVVAFRGRNSVAVPASIYSTLMGILMGVLATIITYFYANGWVILTLAFGVTTLIFGVMALIGLTAKSKLNGLLIIGMGMFFGLMLMSGAMIILMLFFPDIYQWWYWILTLGMFMAVMFVTIWDIRNVKTLAERGELTKNVSMYIAFNLYVDFIYILLRVLTILLRVMGKAKN